VERFKGPTLVLISLSLFLATGACSKRLPPDTRTSSGNPENPFTYPFVKEFHLKRRADKTYGSYKAFYLLTEDFEPRVDSSSDLDSIREVLKFASELSSKHGIPWTHFVDANTLAPAFLSSDPATKQRCRSMIEDLAMMMGGGDDCELHLHGLLGSALLDYLKAEEKIHIKESGVGEAQTYRQRKSFFFQSFYRRGYREMVTSLTYGKRLLEKSLYAEKKHILAFRPGGWDHGATSQDTLFYFYALSDAGLVANSGLATGTFGGPDFRVGNDPGHNLATIRGGEQTVFEVSPTAGPGGYINPVLPHDLNKLANSAPDEMPVIVAVYHLNSLQKTEGSPDNPAKSDAQFQEERDALEKHFKTVAELAAAKIVYPITLRDLLAIIAELQDAEASAGPRQSGE
jgi:hypothetical protein